MILSNASVRRPVAVSCLIIGLFLLGANSWNKLGLELMPRMDIPFITVVTIYPGASPEDIETDVAKRIEDQVVSIDGLKHVVSSCMENVCQTLLEFQMDVDVDIAATDVREKIDLVMDEFPEGVEDPKIVKFDVNAKPIITMALTGDAGIEELYDFTDNDLRDRISVISGVADVQVLGGAEREVRILIDREKLAAHGLVSLDIVKSVQEGIRTIPSGHINEAGKEYSVKFDGEYDRIKDIGNLEIMNENSSRCYVRDVAEVKMGMEELRQSAFINGKPCIGIRVVKKSDANAVKVVERVQKELEKIKESLPGGMELIWITDDGTFIESSVSSTIGSIWQGVLLTAAVLFLFLYSLRTTFIVAITMPLTIIISLFFIMLAGQSLNTSTLLALGLSVGILVMNSIVVLENMVKKSETGEDSHEAAKKGAASVAVSVLASAGTNVVVLFPIIMMKSKVGQFFKPFALAMVTVTVVSLFISFTLTPILYSKFMKRKIKRRSKSILGRMELLWNKMFDKLADIYTAFLHILAANRILAVIFLGFVVVIFFHSLSLAPSLGFEMIDEADKGEFFIKLEYPSGYNLERTIKRVHEVEKIIEDVPCIKYIYSQIGKVDGVIGQSSEAVYLAQILIKASDKTERKETKEDILSELRKRLEDYPDAIITASVPSIMGGQNTPIELEIYGEEFTTLDKLALKTKVIGESIPGLVDIDTTVREGKPEIRVTPKRAVLTDLKFPVTSLGMILRGNLEGIIAGGYKDGARTYDIRVLFDKREGTDQVNEFLFPGAPGNPVTLANLAHIERGLAPVQITRKDKKRTAKFFANLEEGTPLGTAVKELSQNIDEKGNYPPGYTYFFGGIFEVMEEAVAEFGEVALIAIVMTYLVLAAILESFFLPFIILVTLPLGLVGVLWALFITGSSIDIFVMLGSVMLVGIVVNNAILIMDQVRVHSAEGMGKREAMIHAARDQFRPIVMITVAAILGMLPLALSRGLGSELRTSIGIASVGGIAVSAVLTLLVLPVLHDIFTHKPKEEEIKKIIKNSTSGEIV
jgi:hydrophobic/amphiphilic exporter-1 (mainly G- bacteria), HAE1 family